MKEIVMDKSRFISPAADVATAVQTYQAMAEFVKHVLREDVDFGSIPGTTKPTLLKPGAEKLLRFFGMYSRMELQENIEDWSGKDRGGEPFFFYRYKALAIRNGEVVAEGIGSCNSWEKKYRYRVAELKCPDCNRPLRKSKRDDGYYCWVKTGGCGANWVADDPKIKDQPRGYMPNPDPADIVNTIDKMAQKRALVAVALVACNASEYFTQDIEDLDFIEGRYVEAVAKSSQSVALEEAARQLAPDYFSQEAQDEPENTTAAEVGLAKEFNFAKRPYDPETLREALRIKAQSKKPASDAQLQLVGSMFAQHFQNDPIITEVKRYLFGSPSLKEADRKLISAALSWMNVSQDSGGAYCIDEMAKIELSAVRDAVDADQIGYLG